MRCGDYPRVVTGEGEVVHYVRVAYEYAFLLRFGKDQRPTVVSPEPDISHWLSLVRHKALIMLQWPLRVDSWCWDTSLQTRRVPSKEPDIMKELPLVTARTVMKEGRLWIVTVSVVIGLKK